MRQQILDKVEECFQIAEKFYNRSFSRPKNIFFKRNGAVGGHCNYSKSELMFQLDFAEAYSENYLKQIVPHEVAHWIDWELYGWSKVNGRVIHHGKSWKFIMRRVYGLDPERCHSYDPQHTKTKARTRQTRYPYKCGCRKHSISQTIHNRILGGKSYYCKFCKQKVVAHVLSGDERVAEIQRQIDELTKKLQNNEQ